MSEVYVGGIEGGSTFSYAVILNSSGKVLGCAKGDSTNPLLVGTSECKKKILDLMNRSKKAAGLTEDTPLDALGLGLSGCEHEDTNQELAENIRQSFPNLAKRVTVSSDTEGSIAATSNKGGMTCIAGTGSNYFLKNPDGTRAQCGGWGYLIGDEGSAYKIAFQAIKYCFDELDNFEVAPHSIDRIWTMVRDHFKIKTQPDILDAFYKSFDKAHIASLGKRVSQLANEGDKLSQKIFYDTGRYLARGIAAIVPKAAKELTDREGGIHVLCVGSVWLSWDLLYAGFISYIRDHTSIDKLSLMRGTTEMGVGAAYMASDRFHLPISRDYSKNYSVFYRFDRAKGITNGTA